MRSMWAIFREKTFDRKISRDLNTIFDTWLRSGRFPLPAISFPILNTPSWMAEKNRFDRCCFTCHIFVLGQGIAITSMQWEQLRVNGYHPSNKEPECVGCSRCVWSPAQRSGPQLPGPEPGDTPRSPQDVYVIIAKAPPPPHPGNNAIHWR